MFEMEYILPETLIAGPHLDKCAVTMPRICHKNTKQHTKLPEKYRRHQEQPKYETKD